MKQISSKRQLLINNGYTWLGTPYQHQAGIKKYGVDCAMLMAGIALETRLIKKEDYDNIPPYPADWHLHQETPLLTETLESFGCVKKQVNKKHPGDILVFKLGRTSSHLGLLVQDNLFIHAYGGSINKVVINSLTGKWEHRLIDLYKFPGI